MTSFNNLSESGQTIVIGIGTLTFIGLFTYGTLTALKRGVRRRIIALPILIILLPLSILLIKTEYQRGETNPLWYTFLALMPFLVYGGFILRMGDIKQMIEEGEEQKRSGKKSYKTKSERVFTIAAVSVMIIGLILTLTVSKKLGLAVIWSFALITTMSMVFKPQIFIKIKPQWDANTERVIMNSTRFSGLITSGVILTLAYFTLTK